MSRVQEEGSTNDRREGGLMTAAPEKTRDFHDAVFIPFMEAEAIVALLARDMKREQSLPSPDLDWQWRLATYAIARRLKNIGEELEQRLSEAHRVNPPRSQGDPP
jgi:hypothetical protein